ncbi:MAG: hypothetical protein R3F11_11935 [Verrucomicrobiales bacterium]
MPRPIQRMIALPAFLLVFAAQVFGLGGWICECAGTAKVSIDSLCVIEQCHPGSTHEDGCADDYPPPCCEGDAGEASDHSPAGDPHQHEHSHEKAPGDSFVLRIGTDSSDALAALPAPEIPSLPLWTGDLDLMPRGTATLPVFASCDRSPPPSAAAVARSVVRLI